MRARSPLHCRLFSSKMEVPVKPYQSEFIKNFCSSRWVSGVTVRWHSSTTKSLGSGGVFLILPVISLFMQFLNGGDNNHAVPAFELYQQVMGIVRLIHVDNVIFSICPEGDEVCWSRGRWSCLRYRKLMSFLSQWYARPSK